MKRQRYYTVLVFGRKCFIKANSPLHAANKFWEYCNEAKQAGLTVIQIKRLFSNSSKYKKFKLSDFENENFEKETSEKRKSHKENITKELEEQFELGRQLEKKNDFQMAIKTYSKVIGNYMTDEALFAKSLYLRSRLKIKSGNHHDSIVGLTLAIESLSKPFVWKRKIGTRRIYIINLFIKFRACSVILADAYFQRGLASAIVGKEQNAISDFKSCVRRDKKHFRAHCCLGALLGTTGKEQEALEHFENALEIKPDYDIALFNRGTLQGKGVGGRNYQSAINDLSAAINLNPKKAAYFYNRALANCNKGQIKKAIPDLKKCLQLNPDFFEAQEVMRTIREMYHK